MKKALQLLIIFIYHTTCWSQHVVFSKQFVTNGIGNAECREISIGNDGDIYIAGRFSDTVDCDPGPGIIQFICLGNFDGFITKQDMNGNIIFAKHIASPGAANIGMQDIQVDSMGNIYVFGHFGNTVDFDPGLGTFNLTSNGANDMFILKLDNLGNFNWVKKIGNTSSETAYRFALDNNNNIYITGAFQGTTDFDPDIGIYNLTSSGSDDCFIAKLNSSGGLTWAKRLGAGGADIGRSIKLDQYCNIYVGGYFNNTVDFNPNAGIFNLGSAGLTDCFIEKLDSSGGFLWATKVGGPTGDFITSIAVEDSGNVIAVGEFNGTADFNPGAGIYSLTAAAGTTSAFLWKLTDAGNFIWAKQLTSTSVTSFRSIDIDTSLNIYGAGVLSGITDFDPGPGIYNLSPLGVIPNEFIAKYNSAGNLFWAHFFTGNSTSYGFDVDQEQNIYLAGRFGDSLNVEMEGLPYYMHNNDNSGEAYIIKWSQDSCSSLSLMIDSVYSISCDSGGIIFANATGGEAPYIYSWPQLPLVSGPIANVSNPDIYSLVVNDANGCSRNIGVLMNGPFVNDFNLNTNVINTSFRPGFVSHLWAHSINEGCLPTSGQLKIILDTLLVYNNSIPSPDLISGDTLFWNFDSLRYDSVHFVPYISVTTPAYATVGDSVSLTAIITPIVGDIDSTNNIKNFRKRIVNGYDPNDKNIYPEGECIAKYILNNEVITYSVRFQNTGNASAVNIYVLDTLDSNLDLNSVRIVGNSHPMFTEVLPGNVLKFRFDNILLPDSNANEPLSHGYVIFEVMPDSGVANNIPIENTSHIFFDHNPPITTNTVNNTLVSSIPNSNSSITQTNCNSATINGYTYTSSGAFVQYFDNYLGCDSIISLNLTILDSSSSQISAYDCYNYTLNSSTYNSSGTYYQTLTNSSGCDSLITLYLTILDSSTNIINTSACDSYTLNSNTYTSSGTYYQTLTNSVGCDSILVLDLTINNIDNSIVQTSYTLTANQAGATYQWIDCSNSNLPISGETSQSFTASANGNYAVIINANGCTDTSACQTIFGFGIDNNDLINGVSISPNPTNSIITISSLVDLKDATIQLTNIDGQILLQKNHVNGNIHSLDLSELSQGMYFVHIYSEGKKAVKKVVKN